MRKTVTLVWIRIGTRWMIRFRIISLMRVTTVRAVIRQTGIVIGIGRVRRVREIRERMILIVTHTWSLKWTLRT
jgi:hypothetical protein